MFHFKQFAVDQRGCAMKINTDGVLLGALVEAKAPKKLLDIGTGTGVIALMLAQRFTDAIVDAVEIDIRAAETAQRNFINSPFAEHMSCYSISFAQFFEQYPGKKYDVIVTNPPFYIHSLPSQKKAVNLAKHADGQFFEKLVKFVTLHLTIDGKFWLILPLKTSEFLIDIAAAFNLYPQQIIHIHSFDQSDAHRVLVYLVRVNSTIQISKFTIYESPGIYSSAYQQLLKPYFINF